MPRANVQMFDGGVVLEHSFGLSGFEHPFEKSCIGAAEPLRPMTVTPHEENDDMVALITAQSLLRTTANPRTTAIPGTMLPEVSADRRPPQLRLIRGGVDSPRRDYSGVMAAVAVVLAVLAVVGIRVVQGGSAAVPGSAAVSVGAVAGANEAVYLVQSGDTLWGIAEALAPGRDPRPVVDALADRNGGTALRAGDVIVVPSELLAIESSVGIAAGTSESAAP